MKYYIAILKADWHNDPKSTWFYFEGFDYITPYYSSDPTKEQLLLSTVLSDAHFFKEEDTFLLYQTIEKIKRVHNEPSVTSFSITDRKLFEIKLKDE